MARPPQVNLQKQNKAGETEPSLVTTMDLQLKTAALISAIPHLRGFAVSLCGNVDRGDDLVQETLVKAWSKMGTFAEGTNMLAWLFTILRNSFYSEYRKRRHEVSDSDGAIAASWPTAPAQNDHMDLLDFRAALQGLPLDQREALTLIGAAGLSYEEAAAVCDCAIGTLKSRVNRARERLINLRPINSVPTSPRNQNGRAGSPSRRARKIRSGLAEVA